MGADGPKVKDAPELATPLEVAKTIRLITRRSIPAGGLLVYNEFARYAHLAAQPKKRNAITLLFCRIIIAKEYSFFMY